MHCVFQQRAIFSNATFSITRYCRQRGIDSHDVQCRVRTASPLYRAASLLTHRVPCAIRVHTHQCSQGSEFTLYNQIVATPSTNTPTHTHTRTHLHRNDENKAETETEIASEAKIESSEANIASEAEIASCETEIASSEANIASEAEIERCETEIACEAKTESSEIENEAKIESARV